MFIQHGPFKVINMARITIIKHINNKGRDSSSSFMFCTVLFTLKYQRNILNKYMLLLLFVATLLHSGYIHKRL